MRFDDMLATVLARPTPDARALGLQWRQLVDLVAQRRDAALPLIDDAYAVLSAARARLPVGERVAAARSIAGQRLPPQLVAVFANDHAAVAAPVMRSARLDAGEWIELLPALGPTARALLRHRDDLDASVARALEGFGAVDLVIEGEVGTPSPLAASAAAGGAPTGTDVRAMLTRIESFRQQRGLKSPAAEEGRPAPEAFRWECGVDGVISWAKGANEAGIVGHDLSVPAPGDGFGVEAAASTAFANRRGFRDARLRTAAGEHWRISGVPLFEGSSGRFLGFRGTGRRPFPDEAEPNAAGLMATDIPAAALREMVHELRTPLNAIIGFAELIDGQFLGPAGQRQRARAGDIRDQAARLSRALEDLDLAARIDEGRIETTSGMVDMTALVARLHEAFGVTARERRVALAVEIAPDLPVALIDPESAERLVSRLFHATIGVRLQRDGRAGEVGGIRLAIDRPEPIRGDGAAAMLDPGYAPAIDTGAAPALGLGFALRLVRNLARSTGGDFAIDADAFVLSLPTRARDEVPSGQRR